MLAIVDPDSPSSKEFSTKIHELKAAIAADDFEKAASIETLLSSGSSLLEEVTSAAECPSTMSAVPSAHL